MVYYSFDLAFQNNDIEKIKSLFVKGPYINTADKYGSLPLTYACLNGYNEIIKLLVENGADVNLSNKWGNTPLMYACQNFNLDIVKLLIKKGADVNAICDFGETALIRTCSRFKNGMDTEKSYKIKKSNSIKIIKLLLKKGADINYKDEEGNTALMHACKEGNLDIVKLLLEKGADKNYKDEITILDKSIQIALDISNQIKNKELIKTLTLHKMKYKDIIQKTSDYSIDIYEILISKIKEKTIVKDIINMKNELELL